MPVHVLHRPVAVAGLAALLVSCSLATVVRGQERDQRAAAPAAGSVQRQIDELKEGQARILNELAELKRLLQEKSGQADMPSSPSAPRVISVSVRGEPFRGEPGARVAIMEYSDFECSFCAKFAQTIYPLLDRDYIKPGRIKYFFRDLPDPVETNALYKARAARCAGDQGKFWEMHDRLFATQNDPASQDLMTHARALGLDDQKFAACLASDRYASNIHQSVMGARRIGIQGTPAFLIGTVSQDGEVLRSTNVVLGVESYGVLKTLLDGLLVPSREAVSQ